MKMTSNYFHCGDLLKNALNEEISEVKTVVSKTQWLPEFEFDGLKNQRAYNRAFDVAFGKCGSPVVDMTDVIVRSLSE